MSGIDWSKAPEWAEAVVESADEQLFWIEKYGTKSRRHKLGNSESDFDFFADMTLPNHAWRLVENRPKPWTGEGMPPVGTKLECCFAISKDVWREGAVVFSGTMPEGVEFVVVDTGEHQVCYRAGFPLMMRPIRTPEQIAAEEREKAVSEMKRIWTEAENSPFYALYDAGYRKTADQPSK